MKNGKLSLAVGFFPWDDPISLDSLMHRFLSHRLFAPLFLLGCCAVLAVLWLPGLRYPLVSDPAIYAQLGKSMWEHGVYTLLGAPFAKHLPMHAILSYPLTRALGFQLGMKTLSLLAGFGVLLMTYLTARRMFRSTLIAALATAGVLLHPAFVLMATMGSADLTFTFFFLASVFFLLRAEDDPLCYLLSGLSAGMMCLTRYNGFPILLLFPCWILWARRSHLYSPWIWLGTIFSFLLPSFWFLRNFLTFGDPLHSEYTAELQTIAPDHLRQFLSNAVYYINPIHNILPVLLLLSLYGLFRFGRQQIFIILCMFAIWAITAIWWVQAIRFAFPGYPLLTIFAAAGLVDLCMHQGKRLLILFVSAVAVLFLISHAASLCVYTYGACNAWYDRTIGGIPKNLGLTPEGYYAWDQGRNFLNAHAPKGAVVATNDPYSTPTWQTGVFRPDMHVVVREQCGAYGIDQQVRAGEEVLFQTKDAPVTYVVRRKC